MAALKRVPKFFDGTQPTVRPIGQILGKALASLDKKIEENPGQILAYWDQIAGKYAPFSKALSFDRKTLVVKVKNSAVLAELERVEKPRLLQALQARFPQTDIQTLLFRM